EDHRRVAKLLDQAARRWIGEHARGRRQGRADQALGPAEIGLDGDADLEGDRARGVAGVVDDRALEHGRVGDADVVALEGQEDGRARGQAYDSARELADLDEIVGLEGL